MKIRIICCMNTGFPRIKATSFKVLPRFSGMLRIFAECTVNLIQDVLGGKIVHSGNKIEISVFRDSMLQPYIIFGVTG